ncbi:MAG: hypothetical protein N2692_00540 [Patescibacteria group bacterium]|jgi:uncharacterized membrane protein|nr:hypothetical protein [Patescibacteria group bacterium]
MPRKKSSTSNKKTSRTSKNNLSTDELKITIDTLSQHQEKENLSKKINESTTNNYSEEIFEEKNNLDAFLQKNNLQLENEKLSEEDIKQNKYVAVFSYLSFLFLIPLFLKRDSQFCQKHAKQGLVWFALQLVTSIFYFIPIINMLYGLLVLAITLNSFFQTLLGRYWRIPILYKWAEKINL